MDDTDLLNNIKNIFRKMACSAMKDGRDPEDVKLIAVTKNVNTSAIMKAVEIGLREFGESRVQAAQKKIIDDNLKTKRSNVKWHLIGHLQKNKVKTAVQLFDLLHSVDSLELADEINKEAQKIGKIQRILVQVKLSEEVTKHGVPEKQAIRFLEEMRHQKNLKLEGLMTIPPFSYDPEEARPYFKKLKEIKQEAEQTGFRLPELSMGMSGDFEVAIEEGATMIRIGTAIFGERLL